MKPFFTIVTVCLNAGDQLQKTISSVLKQNFQDYNIIVKDGVSTDGSFESLTNDKKIILVQRADQGIYDAMNQALECVTSKYVLFLNAGDFFIDNSVLQSYYDTILNNNYPDLVYCDYKTTKLNEYVLNPNALTHFFLFRTMLCHQVCMIKTDAYRNLGFFDTNYKVDADYDFLLRLIIDNKGTYKHFKQLGVLYTSGGFSAINRKMAKKEVESIRKNHFGNKCFIYKPILLLTLPSLRIKIANGSGCLSKIYLRIVNTINR